MLPNRLEVLGALKALIPDDVPYVTNLDWPMEGWRPLQNVHLFNGQPQQQVKGQQTMYGQDAVTIGTAWSTEDMKPVHDAYWIGIYVKDIDTQVELFLDQLEQL